MKVRAVRAEEVVSLITLLRKMRVVRKMRLVEVVWVVKGRLRRDVMQVYKTDIVLPLLSIAFYSSVKTSHY